PGTPDDCYLPHFENSRVLLVCPFATVLRDRATKEIFEGVWSKSSRRRWFYPKSVEALEFPYGFSKETHERFPTAIHLFNYIVGLVEAREFDVALIGAGGLAIPLASHVKNMGKVGMDLGGHLQTICVVI